MMVKTIDMLLSEYSDYKDPYGKIRREVRNNKLFPIIRGLYETDSNTSGLFLASIINKPSYISFDYALSYYGLIPERAYLYTSATYNKRKSKYYETTFGNFFYRDVPKEVYPYGIETKIYDKYVVFIARPEKALLDKLYTLSPVSSLKELEELLFMDLRIDEELFLNLDKNLLEDLIPKYKSTNTNMLLKLIERVSVK